MCLSKSNICNGPKSSFARKSIISYCTCIPPPFPHALRLEFLAEHTSITVSDLRLNSETFRWLERMPPILEEHRDITTRSRREAEEALKVNPVLEQWPLLQFQLVYKLVIMHDSS